MDDVEMRREATACRRGNLQTKSRKSLSVFTMKEKKRASCCVFLSLRIFSTDGSSGSTRTSRPTPGVQTFTHSSCLHFQSSDGFVWTEKETRRKEGMRQRKGGKDEQKKGWIKKRSKTQNDWGEKEGGDAGGGGVFFSVL